MDFLNIILITQIYFIWNHYVILTKIKSQLMTNNVDITQNIYEYFWIFDLQFVNNFCFLHNILDFVNNLIEKIQVSAYIIFIVIF